MKGGQQGLSSPDMLQLDQAIRETAASLVDDVIFRAKEMAQRSYQVQQAFSVVEEEDEAQILAEESATRPMPQPRLNLPPGQTPEIQIDLVGDRSPSPEEIPTYIAPPQKTRQVKIMHRDSISSLDEPDEPQTATTGQTAQERQEDENNMRNAAERNENQIQQNDPQCDSATDQEEEIFSAKNKIDKSLALSGIEEASRKKAAREYMCSKPASLPFVDDSPPCFAEIESPSEAKIAERLATSKSPLRNDTKCVTQDDPDLRHFVDEYVKGITEQAKLLVDERVRKSIPHAKYHSPTDGPRASVVLTVKQPDGSWYSRLRTTLSRCLQSSCFCVNVGRRPDAV